MDIPVLCNPMAKSNNITKPRITICTEDDNIVCINQQNSMQSKSFKVLNECRRQNQLCDVVLITEGKKLSAHKIVLAATIPYFHMMFTTDMLEANQKNIDIHELDWETMEQLVSFAYTGEIRISAGNVQSIMIGANYLQLEDLVEECSKFFIGILHPSNALSIRSFCTSMNCRHVVQLANRYVQKHFVSVSQNEDFLALDLEDLTELLNKDGLYVQSEEEVFTAAINWIQHDLSRQKLASKVLSCVRMPLLKPSFLTDMVAAHKLVRGDIACRDLVDEAKDYHLIPERRLQMKSFRIISRCCKDVPGLIFAIGGLTSSGDSLSTVEVYDPLTKKWSAVKPMSTLRSRVGVAVHERKIYAIGGFNGRKRLKVVEVFDHDKNTWKTVAPLARNRSALGAIFIDGLLFVCGGYDGIASLATVEVYNPVQDEWMSGPSMSKPRSAAGIAVLQGYIYVIGGHDGTSIYNSVERYNMETRTWESVPSMQTQRCRLGATVLNDKIYVCGGYDGSSFLNTVECFDPVETKWYFVKPMLVRRSRVSLIANTGKLYAIAGYDGQTNLSSMEIYDEETDTWEFGTQMSTHEGGVGVGVLPMSPAQLF